MNAGIITLHFSVNYGAVLQCLGLAETLKKNGIEVQIIDYYPDYAKYYWEPKKKYLDAVKDAVAASNKINDKKKHNVVVRCLKSVKYAYVMNCKADSYKEKYDSFNEFRKKYLPLTEEIVNMKGLEKLSFDLLITGSDQVWNSDYTNYSFDKAYFLKFGKKDVFRMAYAASTYVYESDKKWSELLNLAKDIDCISVREKKVCQKINEISNYKTAVTVLDPILLLDASEWERFEKSWENEKEYILIYSLRADQLSLRYVEKIKKIYNNLDVIDLSPNKLSDKFCWKGNCAPDEFLSLIHKAKVVITDSFHGTVFSLIYNRQFISIAQNINDTRIQDLLNAVGLGARCKKIYEEDLLEDIEYTVVNKKLSQLRNDSLDFLLNNLKKLKYKQGVVKEW